jgi:hypothetical protein
MELLNVAEEVRLGDRELARQRAELAVILDVDGSEIAATLLTRRIDPAPQHVTEEIELLLVEI